MGQLDRYGDPTDDEPDSPQPSDHDARCRDGWLGEDTAGRPIPCLTCRPHLASGMTNSSTTNRKATS